MKQDLLYIASGLKLFDPELRHFLGNSSAPRLSGTQIVDSLPELWHADTLYIINSSALPDQKPDTLPPNLLCQRDSAVPLWLNSECGSNVIITSTQIPEGLINETLSDMRGVQRDFSFVSDSVVDALYYGKGIQAIADIAAEALGNTVSILDTNWKVLAVSYRGDRIDPRLKAASSTGYVDTAVIEKMKADGRFEELRRNGQLIILPPPEEDPECYGACWCYVRINGTVSAYLVVYANQRPFTHYHPELITRLAHFTAMELQKEREFSSDRASTYEALMLDLLERRITDQLVIIRRLRLLDQKLEPLLHVIAIRRMSAKRQAALSPIERSRICDFFPGCLAVAYQGDLVLLVSSEDGSIPMRDDSETLEKDLRTSGLSVGISNVFRDIGDMARYYRQSIKALEFGWNISSRGGLFHYSDYAMYHALELCTKHVDLRDLCHPGLLRLQESHDPGDRDLFQTLYLYLLYMKDVNRVSQGLNIHRSTLFYRLNKIKAIIGTDLDDGDVISHLMFSFKLIEYMDIFAPGESPLPPQ